MLSDCENLAVLVVPTEQCNMNCVYCYHRPHHHLEKKVMNTDTLEQIMKITLPYFSKVSFIWHGGEPLLMGVDFYKKALDLQGKYGENTIVRNSIQTNLSLLTEEFVDFFIENKFYVSSSHDGVSNDYTRGNSELILSKRTLFKQKNREVGNVMVLSRKTIYNLIDSYDFFKAHKISYKMNLYIDTIKTEESKSLMIDARLYLEKMSELFDCWISDVHCNIRVGNFVELIKYFLFEEKHVCCYTSCLGKWIGVRADGTIANCVRYFPNDYLYGNVFDYVDIREAFLSSGFRNMLFDSVQRRSKCKKCEIYDYCQGGCSNEAMFENGMENNGGNSCLCRKGIYGYVKEKVDNLKNIPYTKLKGQYNPYFVKLVERYQTTMK